jgi:hypothetical protein
MNPVEISDRQTQHVRVPIATSGSAPRKVTGFLRTHRKNGVVLVDPLSKGSDTG